MIATKIIPVKNWITPIFPGITDFREIVKATRAWVDTYWFENLNLKNTARNQVARAIGQHYPGLIPIYRAIYRDGDKSYWYGLIEEMENFCARNAIAYRNLFHP